MLKLLVLSFALIASVPPAIAQEAQTLKERLSDKASDAQRVDNCHVPPERRGALPRPDCPEKPRPAGPRPRRRAESPLFSLLFAAKKQPASRLLPRKLLPSEDRDGAETATPSLLSVP
jgi:hypothetical protein